MRTHGRTDANQTAIVAALRRIGCSVTSLASVGGGCPDLLVGWRSVTVLMEVKDGSKCPSKRTLTEAETEWHEAWTGGPAAVVEGPQQAVNLMIALDAQKVAQ